MTLTSQRDAARTAAARFLDPRSYFDLAGNEHLEGKDWGPRRHAVWWRDNGYCAMCGEWVPLAAAEIDHIVSRGLGGPDNIENLRTLCPPCHRGRHVQTELGGIKIVLDTDG